MSVPPDMTSDPPTADLDPDAATLWGRLAGAVCHDWTFPL